MAHFKKQRLFSVPALFVVRKGLFFHFSMFITTQPCELSAVRDLLNLTIRCSKLQQWLYYGQECNRERLPLLLHPPGTADTKLPSQTQGEHPETVSLHSHAEEHFQKNISRCGDCFSKLMLPSRGRGKKIRKKIPTFLFCYKFPSSF